MTKSGILCTIMAVLVCISFFRAVNITDAEKANIDIMEIAESFTSFESLKDGLVDSYKNISIEAGREEGESAIENIWNTIKAVFDFIIAIIATPIKAIGVIVSVVGQVVGWW